MQKLKLRSWNNNWQNWAKLITAAFVLIGIDLPAQEEKEKPLFKHSLGTTFSYAFVPKGSELSYREEGGERGYFVPGIGLDYYYRPKEKWAFGIIADLELAHYLIPRDEDLERERAFLLLGMAGYEVLPKLSVLAGGGYEFEKHKNLFVFRSGVEYEIEYNENWFSPVGAFYDFKEEFDLFSISVGVTRRF